MKYARIAFLLVGAALLVLVLQQSDLPAAWARVKQAGILGLAAVLGVYLVSFIGDTLAWQLTLPSARLNVVWLVRLWRARMVGSAFNAITPFASLGGEPVKAMLLKRHHGIGYHEGSASLILERTVNTLALLLFLAVGFAATLWTDALPPAQDTTAAIGFGLLAAGIVGFFFVQRLRLFSRIGHLFRGRRSRDAQGRLLATVREVEDRLIAFYTVHRGRFAWSSLLALLNWVLGAVEIYVALYFLGHPVTLAEAWIIEAVAVLVRNALFFIPASVGAQEGAFVLIVGAITGSPALGLATAVLRRVRELVFICAGLGLCWHYAAVRPAPPATGAAPGT